MPLPNHISEFVLEVLTDLQDEMQAEREAARKERRLAMPERVVMNKRLQIEMELAS